MKPPLSRDRFALAPTLTGLSENHARHVISTFRYLDELLDKAERIMVAASTPSPFQEYANDTTPIQRKVTHDYVACLRQMMGRHLDELHIPRPKPVTGALWAARNAVTFAEIALADMRSGQMRGYGQLSETAAQTMDALVAELRTGIERLDDYLARGTGVDLAARLQALEGTGHGAPVLRELDRIITTHGLVEFREALAALLERWENAAPRSQRTNPEHGLEVTFEIGVFGRVSSGKSSLLNHLLDGEVLPVGVTPVTSVPTRIMFGPRPQVIIEFADGPSQRADLAALSEFATEQQNPNNAKHVARLHVQVPSAKLRAGIALVDTPGLGSLAQSGAEETAAYLPRCDLGILLVSAGAALTHEDLQTIQALYRAGATAMVLVSKADLLDPSDRERTVAYVRTQILSQLNAEPPVHLVSIRETDVTLCDQWLEGQLRPLLEAHRELAAASLRRKLVGLREAVLATLKRKAQLGAPAPPENETAPRRQLECQLRNLPHTLEAARREAEDCARNLPRLQDQILEDAAYELVSRPKRDSENVSPVQLLPEVATRVVRKEAARIRQDVEQVRDRLGELMQAAVPLVPSSEFVIEKLPELPALPLPDTAAIGQRLVLVRPIMPSLLGGTARHRQLRRKMSEQAGPELQQFLSVHSQRLNDWVKQSFDGMKTSIAAGAGILLRLLAPPQLEASAATPPSPQACSQDIQLLEQWEEAAGEPKPSTVR